MAELRTCSRRRIILAVGLLLAILLGPWAQGRTHSRALPLNRLAGTPTELPDGSLRMELAIGDDYFDGTSDLNRVRRHFRIARELGVKYLRCAFSWNAIEKRQKQHDWRFWDMLVRESQNSGVRLIPYVAYTPEWAAVEKSQFWSQPPRDPSLYADFMYQLVRRYRGKIQSWEIWNEPDNPDYWRGPVRDYAEMVQVAARAMRRADPSIVLVLGGMSKGPSVFFRSLMTEHHIGRYVDVIAMHGYPESWDEERAETVYQDWIKQMADLVSREGMGAALWVNEMGYADYRFSPVKASEWGVDVFYDYEHTSNYAATFLFKSEVMALASQRVSLTGWYRIDDFSLAKQHFSDDEVDYHLGLVDVNGKPKPQFYAMKFFASLFAQAAKLLPDSVPASRDSQAVIERFRRADGMLIVIGWLRSSRPAEVIERTGMPRDTRQEVVSIPLPCQAPYGMKLYDVEGRPSSSTAVLSQGELKNVVLRGDNVFIATANCK